MAPPERAAALPAPAVTMGGEPEGVKVGASRVMVPTELGVGIDEATSVVKDEGGL